MMVFKEQILKITIVPWPQKKTLKNKFLGLMFKKFWDIFKNHWQGKLDIFDRIIIKGYIRQLCNVQQFKAFLSIKNILWKDFPAYAQNVTKNLCDHVENIASSQNRPYTYLKSPNISKEQTALKMLEDSPIDTGLIGIIATVETCNSMSVSTHREWYSIFKEHKN